ncbi:hypothetical protein GQ53DRAFT_366957 [Thozetella sp. PMI_491]|nr:hypothetical protein GQ53DRAFT_366957 [Thozetella sp. PMI_491]
MGSSKNRPVDTEGPQFEPGFDQQSGVLVSPRGATSGLPFFFLFLSPLVPFLHVSPSPCGGLPFCDKTGDDTSVCMPSEPLQLASLHVRGHCCPCYLGRIWRKSQGRGSYHVTQPRHLADYVSILYVNPMEGPRCRCYVQTPSSGNDAVFLAILKAPEYREHRYQHQHSRSRGRGHPQGHWASLHMHAYLKSRR